MSATDEGKTKETQTEGWGNVEVSSVAENSSVLTTTIANKEHEIKAKD